MKTLLAPLTAAALLLGAPAFAAGEAKPIEDIDFSFEGPFGSFDEIQLQRGFQIYSQVCSGCHGLQYVALRDLEALGYSDAQIRAYIAEQGIVAPDDGLEALPGDERDAVPSDKFPKVSGEGMGPDLSLMAKARAGFHGPVGTGYNQLVKGMGGPEYVANLLMGYTGEEKEEAGVVLYENKYFPGGWIQMAPPLYGDDVEYSDGTEATLEQASEDVAAFLMWTAEPKLEDRKQAGLTAFLFLGILSVLLYLTNKKIWMPVKNRAKGKPDA